MINDPRLNPEFRDYTNENKFLTSSINLSSINNLYIKFEDNYGQEFNLHVKKNVGIFDVLDIKNKITFHVETGHKRDFIETIKRELIEKLEERDRTDILKSNPYKYISEKQMANAQISMDAVTRPEFYYIPGEKPFTLTQDQVNKLVKIGEFEGSNIELKFILKNNTEIKGFVTGFKGHNCLSPSDTFIPIVFNLQTEEGNREIFSIDIKTVIAHTLPIPQQWILY
jgi:hypothetical protein